MFATGLISAYLQGMVRGAQLRAARALLDWRVVDLARRAGVNRGTILRAESVNTIPPIRTENLDAIVKALEAGGVRFIDQGDGIGIGVQLVGPIPPLIRHSAQE